MAKKIIEHDPSSEEKKEYKNEMDILESYRKVLKDDVRTVIREEWNEHYNNHKDISIINLWMGMIIIKGKPIYLTSIALLGVILYILVK